MHVWITTCKNIRNQVINLHATYSKIISKFTSKTRPGSPLDGSFRRSKSPKKVWKIENHKTGLVEDTFLRSNRPIALFLWGAMVSAGCARIPCRQCGWCVPSTPARGESQPTTSSYMFLLVHTCSCLFHTLSYLVYSLSLTFSNLLFLTFSNLLWPPPTFSNVLEPSGNGPEGTRGTPGHRTQRCVEVDFCEFQLFVFVNVGEL